jgi:glycosyltransferase involved in cell wall biosynthesis
MNRPAFLAQCSEYVTRQTYPKELLEWVIVDAGDEPIDFRGTPDIRTQVLSSRGCVGMLRNQGCRVAWGDIIVHFDDDDWHNRTRVEQQVGYLLAHPSVDLVCSEDYHVLLATENPPRGMKSWSWGFETFSSGGTFAYRKKLWQKRPFANIQTGEDQVFAKWARLDRYDSARNMRDAGLFVCVRHKVNTCHFEEDVKDRATVAQARWIRDMMGPTDYSATITIANS